MERENERGICMSMSMKVACKGFKGDYTDKCEYNSTWFCKNPKCKTTVLTSTLVGARPSGCPLCDMWNVKEREDGIK